MNKIDTEFDDERLGNLIRQAPLEAPSDDFLEHVMMAVSAEPEMVAEKRSLSGLLKTIWPYAALVAFFIIIYMTSDIPGLQQTPEGNLLSQMLLRSVETIIGAIQATFSSAYVSWGLLVGMAGGLLYVFDQWLSRKRFSY
mgnify:CR=1 FL=1